MEDDFAAQVQCCVRSGHVVAVPLRLAFAGLSFGDVEHPCAWGSSHCHNKLLVRHSGWQTIRSSRNPSRIANAIAAINMIHWKRQVQGV